MKKGNLLILEDEVALNDLLKDLLGPHADEVFTAYNGIEGLDIVAANQIDAIVCDINMPKMNGVEFIAKMRELNNQHPIIFYTAHGNDQLIEKADSYGAFEFLSKPNFDNLEETVVKALQEEMKSNSVHNKKD